MKIWFFSKGWESVRLPTSNEHHTLLTYVIKVALRENGRVFDYDDVLDIITDKCFQIFTER